MLFTKRVFCYWKSSREKDTAKWLQQSDKLKEKRAYRVQVALFRCSKLRFSSSLFNIINKHEPTETRNETTFVYHRLTTNTTTRTAPPSSITSRRNKADRERSKIKREFWNRNAWIRKKEKRVNIVSVRSTRSTVLVCQWIVVCASANWAAVLSRVPAERITREERAFWNDSRNTSYQLTNLRD